MNTNKYYIKTFGCQMNVHESEKISQVLYDLNYDQTNNTNDADIIAINTCCVRDNAERKIEGYIGNLKKIKECNKNLIIVVCGCMTQQTNKAQYLKNKFPYIDIILGTHKIHLLSNAINNIKNKQIKTYINCDMCTNIQNVKEKRDSYPNAWIDIMYGCNNFCTYCIVPYVRGREQSRKQEDIINDCKNAINNGYKEITLLGQNVNSYGFDINTNFSNLLQDVSQLNGDFWIRFMTNHPKDFNDNLINVIKNNDKICKSIHLPLQSGSNKILKLMNRKYTIEQFTLIIQKLRIAIPNISISTDIIVGFPHETNEDFQQTLNAILNIKFDKAYIFIYSERTGTPAATFDNKVDKEISTQRINILLNKQKEITYNIINNYIGKSIKVLCKKIDYKNNIYYCVDEHNKLVIIQNSKNKLDILGKFIFVNVDSTLGSSLICSIKNI